MSNYKIAGPNIGVRGIRSSLPSNYIIGRASQGNGPAELIAIQQLGQMLQQTGQTVAYLSQLRDVQLTSLADKQRLRFSASVGKWVNVADTLANLTDVNTTGVITGQLLQFNGTVWAPWTLTYTLAGASDVLIATPADKQVLAYVAGATKWENVALNFSYNSDVAISSATADQTLTFNSGTGKWVNTTPGSPYASFGLRASNNAVTPTTKFDCTADMVFLRNPTTGGIITVSAPGTVTNDVTVAGPAVNGRDQAGAFAASSWLHLYWISGAGQPIATLSSVSATSPTLPTNYTHWAYIGALRFNGSSQIVPSHVVGDFVYYDSNVSVLAGGSATSTTPMTSIDTSAAVPPNASVLIIQGNMSNTNTASANQAFVAAVAGGRLFSPVCAIAEAAGVTTTWVAAGLPLPNISQTLYYNLTATGGALNLNVCGYRVSNGTGAGAGGGSSTLAGDTDVAISAPANGQVLTYNSGSSKWTNQAPAASGAPAPTIVQHASFVTGTGAATFTLGSVPTPGNTLVAFIGHFTNTVPNNAGWLLLNNANGGVADGIGILTKLVFTGDSVTQTPTSLTGGLEGIIFEIKGSMPALMQFSAVSVAASHVTATQNIPAHATNDLIIGCFWIQGFAAGAPPTLAIATATTDEISGTTGNTTASGDRKIYGWHYYPPAAGNVAITATVGTSTFTGSAAVTCPGV